VRIYPGAIIDCENECNAFVDILKYADTVDTEPMYLRRYTYPQNLNPVSKDWVGVANYVAIISALSLILWIAHYV
jgi:hypothetical protein